MKTTPMAAVRQKSTGLYLRMAKFDPVTKEPLYGPLEAAWISASEPQAIAQAGFLGEDHEPVIVTFAASNLSELAGVAPEQVRAVISNANAKIFLKH